jgi:nitrite reductase/ring-hydroxylating ferredoxin subunit
MSAEIYGVEANLHDVPFAVRDPELIPARRYYDQRFFELERERLWPRVWQMACRLEEIPQVGDWIEYRLLDKSVIVVRAKTGVKAFHNACRHRGVELAQGHGNCKHQGFVCPFHGWRYDMEGKNTLVFGRQLFSNKILEPSQLALAPCRVELWGGCAFINFDDRATPLVESLGPVTRRLDSRHVDKLKVEWWHSAVLPVNWKLAMEAFMEGYHVMRTHPQLQALIMPGADRYAGDAARAAGARALSGRESVDLVVRLIASLREGMAGMIDAREMAIAESLRDMDLPESAAEALQAFDRRLRHEITLQGRARGIPMFDLNRVAQTEAFHGVEFMFPHYFLLPMYSAMSSYRVRPLTAESCLFEIWSLALHPEDETRDRQVAPVPMAHDDPRFPEIPRQDYFNLPRQQRGLHAEGFEHMRLSGQVEGMISNYHRLIDGYLARIERSRLAQATHVVCSGYDGPILDLGFQ